MHLLEGVIGKESPVDLASIRKLKAKLRCISPLRRFGPKVVTLAFQRSLLVKAVPEGLFGAQGTFSLSLGIT